MSEMELFHPKDEHMFEEIRDIIEKENRPLIIYCAGTFGQVVLSCLKINHITPFAFCDNSVDIQADTLWGVSVISFQECITSLIARPVFIIANCATNICESIMRQLEQNGFTKRQDYFLASHFLRSDIVHLQHASNLYLAGQCENFIFAGIPQYCNKALEGLRNMNPLVKGIYCKLSQEKDLSQLNSSFQILSLEECCTQMSDAMFSVCFKPVVAGKNLAPYQLSIQKHLMQKGISSRRILFDIWIDLLANSLEKSIVGEQQNVEENSRITQLEIRHVDKILCQYCIRGYSGTFFLNSVLDGHPSILTLGMNRLTPNLLFFIWRIQHLKKEQMPYKLIEMVKYTITKESPGDAYNPDEYFPNPRRFAASFLKAVRDIKKPTDRDLFIAVYIAYFYMLGRTYDSTDLPVLYIEPHRNQFAFDVYTKWFDKNFSTVVNIEIVRNTITASGSLLHSEFTGCSEDQSRMLSIVKSGMQEDNTRFGISKPIIMRFEDLKMYPQKTLAVLLKALQLPWSETLTQTSNCGHQWTYQSGDVVVKGFDLYPVFNQYEQYFDPFDRFRLGLLYEIRQRAYGYEHINSKKLHFPDKQVDEWFSYPFRMERAYIFESEDSRKAFREAMQYACVQAYCIVKNNERYPELFQFEGYVHVL